MLWMALLSNNLAARFVPGCMSLALDSCSSLVEATTSIPLGRALI